MPELLAIRRSFPVKVRFFALFSLGIFLVVITVIGFPLNYDRGTELNPVLRIVFSDIFSAVSRLVNITQ
jgi:hypothetical protein